MRELVHWVAVRGRATLHERAEAGALHERAGEERAGERAAALHGRAGSLCALCGRAAL